MFVAHIIVRAPELYVGFSVDIVRGCTDWAVGGEAVSVGGFRQPFDGFPLVERFFVNCLVPCFLVTRAPVSDAVFL